VDEARSRTWRTRKEIAQGHAAPPAAEAVHCRTDQMVRARSAWWDMALKEEELAAKSVVHMEMRSGAQPWSAMVSNLMVVLCGESEVIRW